MEVFFSNLNTRVPVCMQRSCYGEDPFKNRVSEIRVGLNSKGFEGSDIRVLCERSRSRSLSSFLKLRSLEVRAGGNNSGGQNLGSSENSDERQNDDPDRTMPSHDNAKSENWTYKSHQALSHWREVRAALVAQEKKLLHNENISPEETALDESTQGQRSRWAHPITMPETGCVLVATEKLDGVRSFERTVVLLLRLGTRDPRDGPFGVIINRPLNRKIKHMNLTEPDLATTFSDCSLHFGGPLDTIMFLVKTSEQSRFLSLEQFIPGICYGSLNSLSEAASLVKKGIVKPEDFRFFVGYAGWQLDQLLEEIESDYWVVASCGTALIDEAAADSAADSWEEILQLMGGQYSELSRRPKQDG